MKIFTLAAGTVMDAALIVASVIAAGMIASTVYLLWHDGDGE